MPSIPTLESVRSMMPAAALWPQGLAWGLHDFNLAGAQALAGFRRTIEESFGGAGGAAEWVRLAQLVNYDGYRAMFEAQSRNRMGVLLWMSHPAWPSFVWQTYDYYLDPTAGYFGSRKGSEPLHVQWNPLTDAVEVVNYSGGSRTGLTATAQVFDIDGTLAWEKTAQVASAEDSTTSPILMEYPLGISAVHFIRLRLSRGAELVSDNFYWRGLEDANFQQLRQMPKVPVEATTTVADTPDGYKLTTELVNRAATPAIMIRLKVVRSASGDRILPALYGDNYVSLMPGERRTVTTEVKRADARGERPRMALEGFNLAEPAAKAGPAAGTAVGKGGESR
jgi:hypothetical protein